MRHLRSHAITRARQRYDIVLSWRDIDEINQLIQGRGARLIGRLNSRKTKWAVDYRGKCFIAVYDTKHSCVATFLPPEADDAPMQVLPGTNPPQEV